jgi:hypothetical protein
MLQGDVLSPEEWQAVQHGDVDACKASQVSAAVMLQGDVLSPEEWAAVEELGILVDQDDQGVLMQIFTKPLGDR